MFRFRSIATGIMALGLTAAVPAFARADQFRGGDRDDHRDVHRVDRDDHVRVDRDDHGRDWDHHDWDHHDWDRRSDDRVRVEIGSVPAPVYVPAPAPVYVPAPAPVYVRPDVDRNVNLYDVPACVLDTANRARQGPIESVQYVCRDGKEFYRFVIDGRGHDLDMRVGLDGRLLSVEAC